MMQDISLVSSLDHQNLTRDYVQFCVRFCHPELRMRARSSIASLWYSSLKFATQMSLKWKEQP